MPSGKGCAGNSLYCISGQCKSRANLRVKDPRQKNCIFILNQEVPSLRCQNLRTSRLGLGSLQPQPTWTAMRQHRRLRSGRLLIRTVYLRTEWRQLYRELSMSRGQLLHHRRTVFGSRVRTLPPARPVLHKPLPFPPALDTSDVRTRWPVKHGLHLPRWRTAGFSLHIQCRLRNVRWRKRRRMRGWHVPQILYWAVLRDRIRVSKWLLSDRHMLTGLPRRSVHARRGLLQRKLRHTEREHRWTLWTQRPDVWKRLRGGELLFETLSAVPARAPDVMQVRMLAGGPMRLQRLRRDYGHRHLLGLLL